MSWEIEHKGAVAVVTMNSNPAGTMDDRFFADLNSVFLSLRREQPVKPVALSSGAKMFSPGLDLEQCLPVFKRGDKSEINRWFEGFLNAMLTVFEHPASVSAAIGGHAIAGGCMLALCCDCRVAEKGKLLVGLNETSIGFPMPYSLIALVEGVLGKERGNKTVEEGGLHTVERAFEIGIVTHLAEPGGAVECALKETGKINSDAFVEKKKIRNGKISAKIKKAFADEDSKNLASRLSSPQTLAKLEGLLKTLKKGKK